MLSAQHAGHASYVPARITHVNNSKNAGQGPCPLLMTIQGLGKDLGKSENSRQLVSHTASLHSKPEAVIELKHFKIWAKLWARPTFNCLSPCAKGGKALYTGIRMGRPSANIRYQPML